MTEWYCKEPRCSPETTCLQCTKAWLLGAREGKRIAELRTNQQTTDLRPVAGPGEACARQVEGATPSGPTIPLDEVRSTIKTVGEALIRDWLADVKHGTSKWSDELARKLCQQAADATELMMNRLIKVFESRADKEPRG